RRGHDADVPGLVDLADLELAIAQDLAVAFGPSERFLEGPHLEQERRRRQLVFARVRPTLGRAATPAEGQARSGLARAEPGTVDEPARLGVSSDEGAHPLDELHGRQLAGFGVRIVLVHHHETHGRLLTVSECGAARAARIRATKGPRLDRRGWRYFCKRRNILINFS